jgi:hypothetical protein
MPQAKNVPKLILPAVKPVTSNITDENHQQSPVFQAAIEVGGRTHSAMSIEHFVLRLPYSVKHVSLCHDQSTPPAILS